jgi:hypothetical protein
MLRDDLVDEILSKPARPPRRARHYRQLLATEEEKQWRL